MAYGSGEGGYLRPAASQSIADAAPTSQGYKPTYATRATIHRTPPTSPRRSVASAVAW